MKDTCVKKCLVVGIILLFVGTGIIPGIAQDIEKPLPTSRGNWLYVGGSGPGNYTHIQYAVNNANPGDTVFVYDDSSPYHEDVEISKSNINLIGEDKNTTIIEGYRISTALTFQSNNCRVSGFSLIGIDIEHGSNYNIISENNITGYIQGIRIFSECNGNIISGNYIHNNRGEGIMDCGDYTSIINNTVSNNRFGIICGVGSYSRIYNNIIEKNGDGTEFTCGIMLEWSSKNNGETHYYVSKNLISDNNPTGLYILDSYYNTIERNDFINNSINNAFFTYESYGVSHNSWLRNYWSDSKLGILPKFIHGERGWGFFFIPWLNLDWFPRKIPYNIGV